MSAPNGAYVEADDVLARYYADLCCSDGRLYYRIVALTVADADGC